MFVCDIQLSSLQHLAYFLISSGLLKADVKVSLLKSKTIETGKISIVDIKNVKRTDYFSYLGIASGAQRYLFRGCGLVDTTTGLLAPYKFDGC
jgi:hypothetical protein